MAVSNNGGNRFHRKVNLNLISIIASHLRRICRCPLARRRDIVCGNKPSHFLFCFGEPHDVDEVVVLREVDTGRSQRCLFSLRIAGDIGIDLDEVHLATGMARHKSTASDKSFSLQKAEAARDGTTRRTWLEIAKGFEQLATCRQNPMARREGGAEEVAPFSRC